MKYLLILLLAFVFISCGGGPSDFTSLVDPFIGTGGHGHTYPGASLPFGMVQLSPDTRLTGWDGCSGYHYSDTVVYGFSHTHLSGTGVPDYGDILFMPITGGLQLQQGSPENTETGYCSAFRKEYETASPGYYSTELADNGVKAELTATLRTGLHRYTFPETERAHIVIDLTHRDTVIDSGITAIGNTEIAGFRRSKDWAKDQHVYFVARFSKPFKSYAVSQGENQLEFNHSPGGTPPEPRDAANPKLVTGRYIKAAASFNIKADEQITVKVGISAVGIEGARKNLEAEAKDLTFDQAKNAAKAAWNQALGRIKIKGGSDAQKRTFYTALYHSLLNPNLYMDVDNRYRGRDLQIHEAKDFTNYTVFSLWDTYRAAHPLFTILEPQRTNDFIRTFIAQYRQGGLLPVWELAANETFCMIGYHSVPVIADAYIKGIRDYDVETAFEAMKHSATRDHFGLKHYRTQGYIPAEEEGESVSKTLEYAYDDWCIAQTAKALGKTDDYQHFLQRAQYYKNVFDPATGFMRARMKGAWFTPFDPAEVNFNYTEANSWQYSFYVPQDVSGLMRLMSLATDEHGQTRTKDNGKAALVAKLDALFSADSQTTGREQADITGLIGQYAHGNEPSHHMAYLYTYAGQPWKTQEIVRRILDTLYSDQPDGLSGNEDCGQMSAWYVFSALGFYPVTPGSDVYVIGGPLFKEAAVDVGGGKVFTVKAINASKENKYIQSAVLNGEPHTRPWITHKDIMNGGELTFVMGASPNKEWGSRDQDLPYSAITEHPILPVPFVAAGQTTFAVSTDIALGTLTPGAAIYYTLDGSTPTTVDTRYEKPFKLDRTAVVKAIAVANGLASNFVVAAQFHRIPGDRTITLNSRYSNEYSAGGDTALIDGIRGSGDYRTGTWQGFHGTDLDAVIDLGKSKRIRKVTVGFIQDNNAWIFMPLKVSYAFSQDGKTFITSAVVPNVIPHQQAGSIKKDFTAEVPPVRARYVRITAKNTGICPSWHKGAGGKAWIFADEIVID